MIGPVDLADCTVFANPVPLDWHRRSQDFCWGGHPAGVPSHASVVHTIEAVEGSGGSVSAPAVNRVMGGARDRKK